MLLQFSTEYNSEIDPYHEPLFCNRAQLLFPYSVSKEFDPRCWWINTNIKKVLGSLYQEM